MGHDGSDHSWRCLDATLVATSPESVAVVALGGPDRTTRIQNQLHSAGIDEARVVGVRTRGAMTDALLAETIAGATPVLPAFGNDGPSALAGILGELIRADAPQALAVGPRADGFPDGPVVVAVDDPTHVRPLLQAASVVVGDATPAVVIARCAPSLDEPEEWQHAMRIWGDSTAHCRRPVPIETFDVPAAASGATVSALARGTRAAMVVARSWHRRSSLRPISACRSLSLVAEAPCPVLIVN